MTGVRRVPEALLAMEIDRDVSASYLDPTDGGWAGFLGLARLL